LSGTTYSKVNKVYLLINGGRPPKVKISSTKLIKVNESKGGEKMLAGSYTASDWPRSHVKYGRGIY
jgi:hypothetical protein